MNNEKFFSVIPIISTVTDMFVCMLGVKSHHYPSLIATFEYMASIASPSCVMGIHSCCISSESLSWCATFLISLNI